MRQNSDSPRAVRLLKALDDMISDEGDLTYVNGYPLQADWMEELASRVQAFIDQNLWGKPVYSVNFPGEAVLHPPYNLTDGSDVLWKPLNWHGVVRRVSPDTSSGIVIGVTCIVVIMSGTE